MLRSQHRVYDGSGEVARTQDVWGAEGISGRVKFLLLAWAGMPKTSFRKNSDSPHYGDEQVNGVAISKNIYNPDWEGFYVNAQYGELSITNPEPIATDTGLVNPVPDEFLITRLAASVSGLAWETQFIRHSNVEQVYDQPVMTEDVLTADEIEELRDNLQVIHAHFKKLYQGDKNFAMDIEFKITETADGSRGSLAIKQARPCGWIKNEYQPGLV